MMIAIGIELTCYYYAFLFATAFLYSKRKEAGAILLGVTALTGFTDWAPTRYLPPWAPHLSQWLDEQYMFMSIWTLVGFVWIMYLFATPAPALELAEARASRGSSGGGGGSSRSSGGNGGGRGQRQTGRHKRKRR